MQHIDPLNNEISLTDAPDKIVSLVPSHSELLYDLELEDCLVGITKFCIHPKKLIDNKVIVGGTKNPNLDAIIKLEPDLIIANKEENRKEDIDILRKSFQVYTSDVYDFNSSIKMINDLGKITGKEHISKTIIKNIRSSFNEIKKLNGIRTLYLIWNNPIMAAGKNTFINSVMEKCGLINTYTGKDRYPNLTNEQIHILNPELIMLSSEPFHFKEKHRQKYLSLFPKYNVQLVDGEAFSWHGSRMVHSGKYLSELTDRLKYSHT